MFRFVGFLWSASDRQQSAVVDGLGRQLMQRSAQWRCAFDHDGLRVFSTDDAMGALRAHRMENKAGVVLGSLFERNRDERDESPPRHAQLDADATRRILQSDGRWLIEHCWGNYAAFISDSTKYTKYVIKDPVGELPCFYTQFNRVSVVFSCIADGRSLHLPLTLNPAFLQAHVTGWNSNEFRPFTQLSQVHRGECLCVTGEPAQIEKRLYWSPRDFRDSDRLIEDPNFAAQAMRATTRSVSRALVSDYDSVLLRLSGGLDSSIISGCLKDAPGKPRVTCYTYFHPGSPSDERPWARMAARYAGHKYVESPILPRNLAFEATRLMPPAYEPASSMAFLQREIQEGPLLLSLGSKAVFTGDGGDSGFCSDSVSYALLEYFLIHGVGAATWRIATQLARLTHRSVWRVLRRSLKVWAVRLSPPRENALHLNARKMVRRTLMETYRPDPQHCWVGRDDVLTVAITRRLGMLQATPRFYATSSDVEATVPPVIAPLYSQPAVELFLRIPIYVHSDGRDRGLARRAFVPDVPAEILDRESKDRPIGFHDELIQRNRTFLRELLLDGELVAAGLLDRAAVENALSGATSNSDVSPAEIIDHMDTELWARDWSVAMSARVAQPVAAS